MLRLPHRNHVPFALLGLAALALGLCAIPAGAQECVISGPTVVCDVPVELCAPAGDVSYEWTGPGGFTSDQRCITVSVPGAYTLRLFDFINGLWMGPCATELQAGDCAPQEPIDGSCPRTAHFWYQQASQRDHGPRRLPADVVARVAAGVDQRMAVFAFQGSVGPFAAVLSPNRAHGARSRALRQVAAVAANVSAGEVGAVARSGARVRIDPAASIVWGGVPMTVGTWLSEVDAELVALDGRKLNDWTRKTYHKIAGFARSLNRGDGLAIACKTEPMTATEQAEEDEQD